MFRYGPRNENLAFLSSHRDRPAPRRQAVLIAGLTEGLLGMCYAPKLSEALAGIGWGTVQIQVGNEAQACMLAWCACFTSLHACPPPQLSSSYTGYGLSSLDRDAEELRLLLAHLKQHYQSEGVLLCGYSTGAQITVRYMQKQSNNKPCADVPPVLGTVLQSGEGMVAFHCETACGGCPRSLATCMDARDQ